MKKKPQYKQYKYYIEVTFANKPARFGLDCEGYDELSDAAVALEKICDTHARMNETCFVKINEASVSEPILVCMLVQGGNVTHVFHKKGFEGKLGTDYVHKISAYRMAKGFMDTYLCDEEKEQGK